MEDEARFCSACGTARGFIGPSGSDREVKKLIRPREGRKIAGVCAGVADYFDMDVTLVRILWILVAIFPPLPGIVAYIVCWIAMPNAPESPDVPSVAAPRAVSPR
jgi:phage shock protein PspC (stress-responsive transcriptional regulator)